jgi:endonuclease/exonuclease/phosphatase family metal-dependent hydrolase
MKLISLNIWGGTVYQDLLDFIKKESTDTDIFCFQEVFDYPGDNSLTKGLKSDIYGQLRKILDGFEGFFSPDEEGKEGIATFYKKDLKIKDKGSFLVHKWPTREAATGGPIGRAFQWITFKRDNIQYNVCQFHGIWQNGKTDTPARLKQSKKAKDFLSSLSGKKIICGDFNLLPDTESIKILEGEDMNNLIKSFNITDTRESLYKKEPKFADYVLVSKDINILEFNVLEVVVSDHLPMILVFN